jgi:phosphotriesterase-related protein
MPEIQTTAGPIDDAQLGRTLVHEHVRVRTEGVFLQWPHLFDEEAEFTAACDQVRNAMQHGVKTIVDPSVMDLGRDIRFMARVAEETGIQLVPATGIYGWHYTALPHHFQTRDVDYMAGLFVHDLQEGIQGTEIRAHFLKCAVDEPGLNDDTEKVLRACAKASAQTGAPIMSHSHPGSRSGLAQMKVFEEEGVDPAKVHIAHTGDTDDLDYIEELLGHGPTIGMDRYGLDIILDNEKRNATVVELCRRGHADRMMLSQDACATIDWFPAEMIPQMAPNWHFTWVFEQVIPALQEAGVTEGQIGQMLDENPRRWLTA